MVALTATRDFQDIPLMPGHPITGSLKQFQGDPIALFTEATERFGDTVRFRVGPMRFVMVRHPDDVKRVLVDHHTNYTKKTRGYQKLRHVLGDGLVTSNGSFWLRQRRIAQPAFHKERIAGFADTMAVAGEDLVASWAARAERGEYIDVTQEMFRVTLRIVGETLLSTDVTGDADAVGEALTYAMSRTDDLITNPLPWVEHIPTAANRKFKASLETLDRVVYDVIAQRRQSNEDPGDLLGMLMEARDEDTGEGMTDKQLRDEVMTIFLAGHETTANALSWTLWLLSEHPEVQQALADEVRGVLGDRPPTLTDLMRMPMTERVMKEGMRLYPPAWMVARRSIDDDVLGGAHIPGDTYHLIPIFLTHRHPDFWTDPEAFNPDRFLPDSGEPGLDHKGGFVAFSTGPRICIGKSMAMMEARLLLAQIVRDYRVELQPGHPVGMDPNITLRPRGGLPMRFFPRSRAEGVERAPLRAVGA